MNAVLCMNVLCGTYVCVRISASKCVVCEYVNVLVCVCVCIYDGKGLEISA